MSYVLLDMTVDLNRDTHSCKLRCKDLKTRGFRVSVKLLPLSSGAHGEKHRHAAACRDAVFRPAMEGQVRPGGSRSSTMTDVSSFRPPCARRMASTSRSGASCAVQGKTQLFSVNRQTEQEQHI